jgi:hypothetical protein
VDTWPQADALAVGEYVAQAGGFAIAGEHAEPLDILPQQPAIEELGGLARTGVLPRATS